MNDAGAPLPPLTFRLAVELVDGGWRLLDASAPSNRAAPVAVLEVSSPLELVGARVRLFDWSDAVVPSDDVVTTVDGGFQARIRPLRALEAGRGYEVVIDGETEASFSDTFARQHPDVRLRLEIEGDVRPARPPVRPGRKTAPRP